MPTNSNNIKYNETDPGWVYVIDGRGYKGCVWKIGATSNLERRMKEHWQSGLIKYGDLVGLIPCDTAASAFTLELILHQYPHLYTKEVLKWFVKSFGGEWNERGLRI